MNTNHFPTVFAVWSNGKQIGVYTTAKAAHKALVAGTQHGLKWTMEEFMGDVSRGMVSIDYLDALAKVEEGKE